jgi:hypothetical protein
LSHACAQGHVKIVERLLNVPNIDVHSSQGVLEGTPLMAAIYCRKWDVIDLLLNGKSGTKLDVNAVDKNRQNCLIILMSYEKKFPEKKLMVIKRLLELGIDVNIKDNTGKSNAWLKICLILSLLAPPLKKRIFFCVGCRYTRNQKIITPTRGKKKNSYFYGGKAIIRWDFIKGFTVLFDFFTWKHCCFSRGGQLFLVLCCGLVESSASEDITGDNPFLKVNLPLFFEIIGEIFFLVFSAKTNLVSVYLNKRKTFSFSFQRKKFSFTGSF